MKESEILIFFSILVFSLNFFKYTNTTQQRVLLAPKPDDPQNPDLPSTDSVYSSLFNEPTDYLKTFQKSNPSENNWISQIL